jgi:hypothetical protein
MQNTYQKKKWKSIQYFHFSQILINFNYVNEMKSFFKSEISLTLHKFENKCSYSPSTINSNIKIDLQYRLK